MMVILKQYNKARNNNNNINKTATTVREIIKPSKSCPKIIVQIQSVHKHNQWRKMKYILPKNHFQH